MERGRLRALINQAALGLTTWHEVTTALQAGFEVDTATIEVFDQVTGGTRAYVDQIDDQALREYEERIFNLNPRVQIGNPVKYTVYTERDFLAHTPAAREYHDWARRHGICRWAAGGPMLMDKDHFAVAAMLTHEHRGPPDDAMVEAWSAMLPVLGNALEIERTLAPARGLSPDMLELATFESDRGYALVDGGGRVMELSAAFQEMLGRGAGLSLHDGRLTASRHQDRGALDRLLQKAIHGRGAVEAVRIRPLEGIGQGVVVRAMALDIARDHFARLRPAALITLIDLDAPMSGRLETLRQIWGLTAREAQLAIRLAGGWTLDHAAADLGISAGTARHHLKSIFRRMEIDRQSDLVRLVARVG